MGCVHSSCGCSAADGNSTKLTWGAAGGGRALVLATVFTPIKFIICIWAAQTSPCYKWKVSLKARAFSVPWWMFLISARSTL